LEIEFEIQNLDIARYTFLTQKFWGQERRPC